jgi:hypothetical protein
MTARDWLRDEANISTSIHLFTQQHETLEQQAR